MIMTNVKFTSHIRVTLLSAAAAAGVCSIAHAQVSPIFTSNEKLAEAKADECFIDIGVDYPPINPDGTCPEGIPKTSESYIWSLTQEGSKLWFGTVVNAACIVTGANGDEPTLRTNAYVCEYAESQYARAGTLPGRLGDWRPPSIYEYELATSTFTERTPADNRILRTIGLRGAGSIDDLVFIAGPSLASTSVNIFAFQSDSANYLGSCTIPGYTNIREWVLAGGVLYVGVGNGVGGSVLRWDGDLTSFEGDFCTAFTEVGRITGEATNVAIYTGSDGQDRLAVSSSTASDEGLANAGVEAVAAPGSGIWISPPLGPDGLTPDDLNSWRNVWTAGLYEPDPIVSRTGYAGGAVRYYNGWLYWGTLHPPGTAEVAHSRCALPQCFGPPANDEELQALKDGTRRAISIWRGRNLEKQNPALREIELLYGDTELPKFNPATHAFEPAPTDWTPLYGPSGFGAVHNVYTWQMATFDNRLFIGTLDLGVFFQGTPDRGGDLWRFDSADSAAVAENITGLGDPGNYGIRGLISLDDGTALIVGMTNPFNLRPGGGWELRRLTQTPAD